MNQPISSWSNISEDVSRCQALRMDEREQSESGGGGVGWGAGMTRIRFKETCTAAPLNLVLIQPETSDLR